MGYREVYRCKECGKIYERYPVICEKCGERLVTEGFFDDYKTESLEVIVAKRTLFGWKVRE
jgi:DNA-directed RNA polymerase subunit RPC12/RpoP